MQQKTSLLEDKVVIGRATQSALHNARSEKLSVGNIELDPERRTVKKCGHLIHLTPTEFELAQQLMSHAGRPIRHALLLCAVWGSGYGQRPEYLRTYMHQLRKKLEDNPGNPQYFLPHSHFGYYFAETC
jgi:two-component system, OmpR family, KDP operon response regulator KdpE